VYRIEPDDHVADLPAGAADAHHLTPEVVLAWLRRIGGAQRQITVVGCEPASLEEGMGLSPAVAAAVDEAVALVRSLISEAERTPSPCA
jgi:hydrogenase maturation protease